MEWEYRTATLLPTEISSELDDLGRDGREFVSFVPSRIDEFYKHQFRKNNPEFAAVASDDEFEAEPYACTAVFKRPKVKSTEVASVGARHRVTHNAENGHARPR